MLYYIKDNGKDVGPMTKTQLANYGLYADSSIKEETGEFYVSAQQIPEIRALLENVPFTNVFEPEKKMVSIFSGPLNSTNGNMYLFDDYVAIIPNIATSIMTANFSKSGYRRQFFSYNEIVELKKGMLALFSIVLSDGRTIKLSGYKKDKLFDEITRRRTYWFQSHNLPIAPLKR